MARDLVNIIDSGEIDSNLGESVKRAGLVESDPSVITNGEQAKNIVICTQADYDNLTTKDPNTIYFIKDE